MMVGKILKMIVYTRTTSGVRRIEEVDMPLKLCSGSGELSVELDVSGINEYLKNINEMSDCYEEITYYFSGDDETVTLYPNKLKERENE